MSRFIYHEDGSLPSLNDSVIFVFGSNLSGIHGAGAARVARDAFGARYGIGVGFQGSAYAIPTKDYKVETLPREQIIPFVRQFVHVTNSQQDMNFFVTRIGCGLAGYDDVDIAPLFAGCNEQNTSMPEPWKEYLE